MDTPIKEKCSLPRIEYLDTIVKYSFDILKFIPPPKINEDLYEITKLKCNAKIISSQSI